jgi:hypothetical protein
MRYIHVARLVSCVDTALPSLIHEHAPGCGSLPTGSNVNLILSKQLTYFGRHLQLSVSPVSNVGVDCPSPKPRTSPVSNVGVDCRRVGMWEGIKARQPSATLVSPSACGRGVHQPVLRH